MLKSKIVIDGNLQARKGFTLLELLVVVSVIAILIGILLPAIQGMKTTARNREDEVTARALENAVRSFRTEYGYWPTSDLNPAAGSLTPDPSVLIKDYLLSSDSAAAKNPRRIPFWDVDAVVTNLGTRKPFTITINLANETVTVK